MVGPRNNTAETARAAFTLIELLAVVAIIGLLSIATVASYQAIANDVRRAGAVEQVKSMLAKTRMWALTNARTTALVFRPVVTAAGVQQIEGVLAQFSGDAFRYVPEDGFMGVQSQPIVARFLPVDSGKPMLLAEGVGIAAPCHRISNVNSYVTEPRLYLDGDKQYLAVGNLVTMLPEAPGVMIAVLFAGDGSQTVLIPEADADWLWVDFNGDGGQRYEGIDYCNRTEESGFNPPPACPPDLADIEAWSPPAAGCWLGARYLANGQTSSADLWNDDERLPMCQRAEGDEPLVLVAPYLAVYDDRDAREELDATRWLDAGTSPLRRQAASRRADDLSGFIDENARQLHFNPNTGVAHEGASR